MHVLFLRKLNKNRRSKGMKKVLMIVLTVLISVAFVTTVFAQAPKAAPAAGTDKPAAVAPEKAATATDKPAVDKPAKEKKAKKPAKKVEKKEAKPAADKPAVAPEKAAAPAAPAAPATPAAPAKK